MDTKIAEQISKSADHNYCSYYQLKDEDTYVEAGAFIGRFVTKIIREQDTGLSHKMIDIQDPITIHLRNVVLIEPCSESASIIKNIINEGLIENGVLVRKAISSKKEKRKFVNWKNNYSASKLTLSNNDDAGQIEEIESDTIDNIVSDLNLQKIDLLCGDIEGEEVNMIKGAMKSLQRRLIKNIAICTYHNEPDNHNLIKDILWNYGFDKIKYEAGITFAKLGNNYSRYSICDNSNNIIDDNGIITLNLD